MSPDATSFLEKNTLQALLGIPEDVLQQFVATAYQRFQDGAYDDVEVLCRGLIAANHLAWYPFYLYGLSLQGQGRIAEALEQVAQGLKAHPTQTDLLALRLDLHRTTAHHATIPRI